MGTGTGGAKTRSGITTKGAGPKTSGRTIGIGASDGDEATKTSAFLSTFNVAGAFSSPERALVSFLHMAQGCCPSKVFPTASVNEPVLEKSWTIVAQATP